MLNFLGQLIHDTKIHRVTREGEMWIKHRRCGMAPVIAAGSVFLALSNSGIRMFPSIDRWRRWELHCFRLLHPQLACDVVGRTGIRMQNVPGVSLRSHLLAGRLTPAMLRATGEALRRAHTLPWTHGDPHLGNVLIDDAGVARLIDFETQHDPTRPAIWRQADDLFVPILELFGRLPDDWPPLVDALLSGYASPAVAAELRNRLHPPTGLERLLWLSRSPGSTADALDRNIARLRSLMVQFAP